MILREAEVPENKIINKYHIGIFKITPFSRSGGGGALNLIALNTFLKSNYKDIIHATYGRNCPCGSRKVLGTQI